MSELEHIEPVSIHSLLTTETLSDTGRSSLTREGETRIAAADVIFAHDTDTDRDRLVHGRRVLGRRALGRRVLEEMRRSCETPPCAILRVEMDRGTNELEHLAAAIVLVKGESDAVDDEG